MPKDFSEEVWRADDGDFLRHLRPDGSDGRAGSDDDRDEDVYEREEHGSFENEESGYLPGMRCGVVDCHVGNPTGKGLRYVIYGTESEHMAEKLFSLLGRFVAPCSIVDVHDDFFYTLGCWLTEAEIEEVEACLVVRNVSHVDWDEEMRKLLTEDDNGEQ